MKNVFLLVGLLTMILTSCIQDDIVNDLVEPELRLVSTPDTILVGSEFQFEVRYFNNTGREEDATPTWTSSDESVISINNSGLATALQKGEAEITINYMEDDIDVTSEIKVIVGETTSVIDISQAKSGLIVTTSSYKLEGNFTIEEIGNKLIIDISENYAASTALPGLYLYLANNINTVSGAYEIGAVQVFEGAHQYEIEGIGINDYSHLLYFCKPFNVKVGDGEIK